MGKHKQAKTAFNLIWFSLTQKTIFTFQLQIKNRMTQEYIVSYICRYRKNMAKHKNSNEISKSRQFLKFKTVFLLIFFFKNVHIQNQKMSVELLYKKQSLLQVSKTANKRCNGSKCCCTNYGKTKAKFKKKTQAHGGTL